MKKWFSKRGNLEVSEREKRILRDFVDREIENIKIFGPAEDSYQKNINSLKGKLS